MRYVADTNVLLRVTLGDDVRQATIAQDLLLEATTIVISLPTLCEFCWVLRRGYKYSPSAIADALRQWLDVDIVVTDTSAAAAGLEFLAAGGDFADGAIALDGQRLGGDVFLTFDREAAALVQKSGGKARFLF